MKHCSRKIVCLFLVVMVLAACAVDALAEDPKGAYAVNTLGNGDRLNVHGTPCIDDIIDHIESGTVVQYLHCDKGWWLVQWWKGNDDLRTGYVDGGYLSGITTGGVYAAVTDVYVHSQSNIPEGQCYNYHTGDMLTTGQRVTVTAQDGIWALVNFSGGSGWVPSIYLEKVV